MVNVLAAGSSDAGSFFVYNEAYDENRILDWHWQVQYNEHAVRAPASLTIQGSFFGGSMMRSSSCKRRSQRRSVRRELDPMVHLTEWAIPDREVEEHKTKMVWRHMPLSYRIPRALRSVLTYIEFGLSTVAAMLFLSFAVSVFSDVLIAEWCMRACLAVVAALMVSIFVHVSVRHTNLPPVFWIRTEVSEYGWGRLPHAATRKAKWVHEHIPHAAVSVDSILFDPYLVVTLKGRDYYIHQWG